ncbi:MAG: pantetheine-phosphate adenylyltransferase [Actinobacteria bacterium]|nr:MAG: pantetheine-phosphate adenylyltransferase [Actinomycetota bacterium]
MKRGVVPGTFDPVTSGHLDIIERAAGLFDELVVGVAHSPDKGGGPLFTVEERVALLEQAVSCYDHVSVRPFDTLLVRFASEAGASVIIKGLRAVTDFEREFQMAALNWRLDAHVETMFIMAVPEYMYLSSSAVKEIAVHGGSVRGLVPDHVADALELKLKTAR